MDKTTAIVITVVVMVLLFFGYTILSDAGSSVTGNVIGSSSSIPRQQFGGGCGL